LIALSIVALVVKIRESSRRLEPPPEG
jgi:hypothetical protein